MKERLTVSEQSCEAAKTTVLKSDEKNIGEEPMKYIEGNQVMSYSELVIPEDDCPLSSLFTLPISKGVTNTPPLPSSAAVSPPGQQFVPVHYPYHQEVPKKSEKDIILVDAVNFQNQELAIHGTSSSYVDPNTPYFGPNHVFDMKEVPSFSEVQVKSDVGTKASEVLKNEKQYSARMAKVSFPIKFGENNRKRQRTNEGVKSALQRKMEHLDKEKERRLRQTKCYEYLRNLVPCGSLKTDKANILEATVAYLTYIKDTLGTSMETIDKSFLHEFERNKDSSE